MVPTDKANELARSPIVFKARGLIPDVRLNVFSTMLHVHSSILKLYSHYFFSFLDAPGGAISVTGTAFKYDWTTKVLDGGKDWQLVSNNDKAGDLKLSTFKGKRKQQTRAFYKIICVMYGLPYELTSAQELLAMTALARFYAALPVLSRSLSASLLRSKAFISDMGSNCSKLLVAAKELRHAELFKDCLLLSLGPWSLPFRPEIKDPELEKMAVDAHSRICSMLCEAQQGLVWAMSGWENFHSSEPMRKVLASKQVEVAEEMADNHSGVACLPCFYRALYEAGLDDHETDLKDDCIRPLLTNHLILPHPTHSSGLPLFEHHFLCLQIRDEDLPWDQTQTDW